VAIGMARAARLARSLGRIADDVVQRQDATLAALALPTAPPSTEGNVAGSLLAIMSRDKKAVGGRLRFVLPARIGRVDVVDDVPDALVRQALGG